MAGATGGYGTTPNHPILLENTNIAVWAAAGLNVNTNGTPNCWTCPNRPGLGSLNTVNNQWTLGYAYFGGIPTWVNNTATVPSRSPIKLGNSKPGWMLAADLVIHWQSTYGLGWVWSDPNEIPPSGFSNLAAHKAKSNLPAGGNEVFCDGSAQWISASKMYFIHSWSPSQREIYFWQDDLGTLNTASLKTVQ